MFWVVLMLFLIGALIFYAYLFGNTQNKNNGEKYLKNRQSKPNIPTREQDPRWYQKSEIPLGGRRGKVILDNDNSVEQQIQKQGANINDLTLTTFFIAWNKEYLFDIVGESNYQDALLLIAGNKEQQSKTVECFAQLIREPYNQYDKNAVVVKIQNKVVGYLSREDARAHIRVVKSMGYDELSICNVRAVVVGGWKKGKSEGNYGVRLDMPLEFTRYKYSHSAVSLDDADSKLSNNPLSQEQKQLLKFFNLKAPKDINYFNFSHYADRQINLIKTEDVGLYDKWMEFNDELLSKQEIYDFWNDKDEREMYDIKKSKKTEIDQAIQLLLSQGKSYEDMIDDPDLVYGELLKINSNLEK